MERFVGIGGKFAAGKDAVADHLVEKHGWTKIGMSDILNEALLTLDPLIPYAKWRVLPMRYSKLVEQYGYVEAKKRTESRRLLQKLGTEVGRNMIDPDLWVNLTAARVMELRQKTPVIVTGIRFPNELDMVDRLGGESWWVERPSLDHSGDTATHSSETSVREVDFTLTIDNDGSLDDLYRRVDQKIVVDKVVQRPSRL